jgi:hypothetical protein
MNMFKESFTEYNEISGNTLSGPQTAFASSLMGSKENYDGSGNKYNIYNTYTSYYSRDDRLAHDRREQERRAKAEKEKKSDLNDNSLLFMGLGVAGLGAAVIVVMALRK